MRLGKINYFAILCYKDFKDKSCLIEGFANNKKVGIEFKIEPQEKLRLRQIIKAKIQNEMKGL
jgi:hypothetical protein